MCECCVDVGLDTPLIRGVGVTNMVVKILDLNR